MPSRIRFLAATLLAALTLPAAAQPVSPAYQAARDAGASSADAAGLAEAVRASVNQEAKLVAGDAAAGDRFGVSVSLSGDRALVGAYQDGDAGSSSGSAYVFVRSGSTWAQQVKLVADDGTPGDFFGISVSLSGDRASAGAYLGDGGALNSGSAYVFTVGAPTAGEAGAEARVSLSNPFPNPAGQRAALTLTLDQPQHVRASVVDALGREVAVLLDAEATGSVRLDVNTAALVPGVYVVRVSGDTFAEARTLTVVR